MLYLKKSLFGFLFLIFFAIFHFLILPLFSSYEWIFGFSGQSALQLLYLSLLILAAAFSFVIFAALSQDWRIGLGFSILGAISPLAFSQTSTVFVLASFYLIALCATYFSVEGKMKKYYNFDPSLVLNPSIRTLASFLAIIISIGFYLAINPVILQKGFEIPESFIPDSLINALMEQQTSHFVQGDKYVAQITPEMIQYAKDHPELLKQYGITPDQLDQIQSAQPASSKAPESSTSSKAVKVPTTTTINPPVTPIIPSTASIKKLALQPINDLLKQYKNFVAPLLALLLFSAFSFTFFIFFFFNILSGIVINSLFYIFEKTNFIHFQKEMREVKKLVV